MTTARPYRQALSVIDAVEELVECSGRQFDSEVVDRFIEVLVDEGALSQQQASDLKKTLQEVVVSLSY